MSAAEDRHWARWIARRAARHPRRVLLAIAALTLVSLALASTLELRLNFTDLLPERNPVAERYRHLMDEWPEPSISIVLRGERAATAAMATELDSLLPGLDGIYNVQARLPQDHLIDHGFALLDPDAFDRMREVLREPSLIGILERFNDDYEREYTDSEENLRDDELEVARALQGTWRALDLLAGHLAGPDAAAPLRDGARSMVAGDPWLLSLDRGLLLISVYPEAHSMRETDELLAITTDVETFITEVAARHPDVEAALTGMGPIGKAEMESIGPYTYALLLLALLVIFLLLARASRGWELPLIQLVPLLVGILWTMGLMALAFGTLNYFTVMMGLVLAGLGIDFTIHLVSRYGHERGAGAECEDALARMLGGTGTGVLTGALTTAAAFLALLIADTRGVFEFGFAAGTGVVLTLTAVFFTLPALLVLRERRHERQGRPLRFSRGQRAGWTWLGAASVAIWRRPAIVLPLFLLLLGAAAWSVGTIGFEYDFMKLEPQDARSVQLQQEIPKRFGIAEQAGWLIHQDVDSARADAEALRDLAVVGEVSAISDYLPPAARLRRYRPQLEALRDSVQRHAVPATRPLDPARLGGQVDRLWDNLDLMSNLAFQAGLDRIVTVVDGMTGYDADTNAYDSTAVLPRLTRILTRETAARRLPAVAAEFEREMRRILIRMTGTEMATPADLPRDVRLGFLPRDGSARYRTTVWPRSYAWSRTASDRFISQTARIAPSLVSTPQLFIVMTEETLLDGRNGSLLALAVIALLLLLHFRHPVGLLAMLPLLGSAVFMIGSLRLIGMKYNYINLIALPIILGIGIDDGVHALHRFREETARGAERINAAFRHVGRAILLTSLTTMIGFGSIALYRHPGMASFGIVLTMGVGFCFVTSAFVLPAVLRVFTGTSSRKGAEE
ncbi:MAG: MMPL family transporter [Candidatus Eisenbacteria bacterium]|nr:MMPL family transporter [Candidatus Eisenbacteria bacterium]